MLQEAHSGLLSGVPNAEVFTSFFMRNFYAMKNTSEGCELILPMRNSNLASSLDTIMTAYDMRYSDTFHR